MRALCFYLHVRAYVSGDVQRITLPGAPPHKHGGSPGLHNGGPSPSRPSSAARLDARLSRGEGGGSSPELRGGKHGGASSSGGRAGGGGEAHERHVIVLARAWDAAQHLFRPAPAHIRMAMLRELQAGSLVGMTGHRAASPTLSLTVTGSFMRALSTHPPTHPPTHCGSHSRRSSLVVSTQPVRQTVPPELRASNPLVRRRCFEPSGSSNPALRVSPITAGGASNQAARRKQLSRVSPITEWDVPSFHHPIQISRGSAIRWWPQPDLVIP